MALLKAQRQQEKEAEKAQKEEEKRSIAQERAKACNLGKRQQVGTTSGSKKKAKVSRVVDDGAGQENNTLMVAAHDNVGVSSSTASITPMVPTPLVGVVPAPAKGTIHWRKRHWDEHQ